MTWIGGVKRYCPVFSRLRRWSSRSSDSVVALPSVCGERFAPADDEAEPRHAFEALVGGGGDRVERRRARVEFERAEGAHRVDQQSPAVTRAQRRDLLDRIENAARRLAVDGEDVGDRRRLGKDALDRAKVRRRVLGGLVDKGLAAGDGENALGALAIGAVDQHQHGAVARDERGQHRFDGEGARALHRHGHDMRLRHG